MLNLDIEEVSTTSKVNYCVLTPQLISSFYWMNNRFVQNVTVRQKVIKFLQLKEIKFYMIVLGVYKL